MYINRTLLPISKPLMKFKNPCGMECDKHKDFNSWENENNLIVILSGAGKSVFFFFQNTFAPKLLYASGFILFERDLGHKKKRIIRRLRSRVNKSMSRRC
uniref:Uncharacterized protein n=1 Tax=Micrurus carvalhoi TaxID=3147026 RepID=A0A2H6N239_9SAUR